MMRSTVAIVSMNVSSKLAWWSNPAIVDYERMVLLRMGQPLMGPGAPAAADERRS
jgi:hypothetical protein